jgi:hypothetical protein
MLGAFIEYVDMLITSGLKFNIYGEYAESVLDFRENFVFVNYRQNEALCMLIIFGVNCNISYK